MGKSGKHHQGGMSKKQKAKQAEHQARQEEKRQDRKSKRELKREKNKFNKAKHESDMVKFRLQLAQYGLKVVEMGGDGNCLFRTIADQLEGNEKLHRKFRQDAVDHIEANKDDFAPFIEDDETIDQYLGDIQKDGVWGGQLELTALSAKYKFNYVIHQVDNPSMAFSNYPWGTVPTIHLSYHLGEHYNSVRLIEDPCSGPPQPIGHELKIKNPIQEEKSETQKDSTLSESGSVVPSRDEVVSYALTCLGVTDQDIMNRALDECLGKGSAITYETIESLQKVIQEIYDRYELEKLQTSFDTTLILTSEVNGQQLIGGAGEASPKQTQYKSVDEQIAELEQAASSKEAQQIKKRPLTDEDKVKLLGKDEMVLSENGDDVVEAPKPNKKCPCNSKKVYKKCTCYGKDLQRKREFIEKVTKKLENERPKTQQTLLLL